MGKKAIFLDRDGVINKRRSDYVKTWKEFEFLDGAADAIRMFGRHNYMVIVITNQSAVNRKLMSLEALHNIHEKMVAELNKLGATIDAIYYCPHTPEEGCECRKPKSAMLECAMRDFDLHPRDCILIGDSETDVAAGKNVGTQTYLLKDGTSLLDIAKLILS